MQDRFKFRIPMFTDKGSFQEFQYIELGEQIECTLCGYNGNPQQCTGLKDKNGKLIYEGDVLEETFKDSDFGVLHDITLIKRDDALASFIMYRPDNPQDITFFADIDLDKEDFKIIGNVYENPEYSGSPQL